MIQVKKVQNSRDLAAFIKFPDALYKGNKYRVPQLHSFDADTLNRKKNPAFDYCEAEYWVAYDGDKVVGRVAGIINTKANDIWKDKFARFGWIDFIDNIEVSSALLKTVEEWAKAKGMTGVHGPMGFTDMDLEGALIEGFDEVGTQAVIYNYPYYPVHYEMLGYAKAADWVQSKFIIEGEVPDKIKRVSRLVKEKYKLRPLKVKKAKELLPYAHKMFELVNESFKDLYGFVPLSEKQMVYYTKAYFSMINPEFVCMVIDENDDVVGFGLSLYSLSQAFIKAKGKLFPFGFIHVLNALRKNDTIDLLLQGVKPKYKNKGIPAIFMEEIMISALKHKVKHAVVSHVLEDNFGSFQLFDDFPGKRHIRRRCYKKHI